MRTQEELVSVAGAFDFKDPLTSDIIDDVKTTASDSQIILLPPCDALQTIRLVKDHVQVTMLDPWYNKGVGGKRDDYIPWLVTVIEASFGMSEHVFVWGFPEIVYRVLDYLPAGTGLVAWLTWYYKNCPSVIRGWRSAQLTCLHLAKLGARLYPEHFLNGAQVERMNHGTLRYMPGPPSVIEAPLNIGFVGRKEQTGHPAQKPVSVFEPLILMTTKPGDIVFDPMCGAGTTGAVCRKLGRKAILCDSSDDYLALAEKRLGTERLGDHSSPKYFFRNL
jgi:site-specific DNA-methyltransferase (adenine-specific)